jgi:hypothetical protein
MTAKILRRLGGMVGEGRHGTMMPFKFLPNSCLLLSEILCCQSLAFPRDFLTHSLLVFLPKLLPEENVFAFRG